MNDKQALNNRRCNQCGRNLIFVKKITDTKSFSSPVTTVIFRCSSASCQSDIDKKERERNKRLKLLRTKTIRR